MYMQPVSIQSESALGKWCFSSGLFRCSWVGRCSIRHILPTTYTTDFFFGGEEEGRGRKGGAWGRPPRRLAPFPVALQGAEGARQRQLEGRPKPRGEAWLGGGRRGAGYINGPSETQSSIAGQDVGGADTWSGYSADAPRSQIYI